VYQYNFALFLEQRQTPYHNYTKMLKYYTLSADQGYVASQEKLTYYLSLKDTIKASLQTYVSKHNNVDISDVFFDGFLSHLKGKITLITWTDPLMIRWIADALIDHLKTVGLDIDVDTWCNNRGSGS
jgi:hypothetical protein